MADTIVDAVSCALDEALGRSSRETVDLAVSLQDLDLNDPPKRVDESIVLSSGIGQDTQIVMFATGKTALRAEDAADEVLGPDELEDFGDDTNAVKDLADETDFFAVEAGLMQDIGRYLGTALGPCGKMPTLLQPDDDVVETVNRMKNTVQLRSRDRWTFYTHVGVDDMMPDEIAESTDVIVRRLEVTFERGLPNIDSVYVKTTMGPSVRVPV